MEMEMEIVSVWFFFTKIILDESDYRLEDLMLYKSSIKVLLLLYIEAY